MSVTQGDVIEVLRAIGTGEITPTPPAPIPIMVLTADTSIEARRRALAPSARDVVTKPFDVFEFGLRVADLIELRLLLERLNSNARG